MQASRTAWVSVASQTTSKASSRSLTSSAPASSTASRTSSSVSPSVLVDQHDALAAEQVGDRAGVGRVAAVAGDGGAHLGRGAVAVVGEALDEDRDAARAVGLVGDLLVGRRVAELAAAALDRAVDVVGRAPTGAWP